MQLAKIGMMSKLDYGELANEFVRNMQSARMSGLSKQFSEGFRGETFVLFFIMKMGGRTVPGNISSSVGVSSARIAAALNNLEDKGLVTREIDSEDRRKIIVELTPKGRDYVEEEQRKQIEKIKNIFISLGENDAKELVRIVGRLGEVL